MKRQADCHCRSPSNYTPFAPLSRPPTPTTTTTAPSSTKPNLTAFVRAFPRATTTTSRLDRSFRFYSLPDQNTQGAPSVPVLLPLTSLSPLLLFSHFSSLFPSSLSSLSSLLLLPSFLLQPPSLPYCLPTCSPFLRIALFLHPTTHIDELSASRLILSDRHCLFCPHLGRLRQHHDTLRVHDYNELTLIELPSCTSLSFTLSRCPSFTLHSLIPRPIVPASTSYCPRPPRPSANNKRHPLTGTK